jgi:hypothetical protein
MLRSSTGLRFSNADTGYRLPARRRRTTPPRDAYCSKVSIRLWSKSSWRAFIRLEIEVFFAFELVDDLADAPRRDHNAAKQN